MNNEMKRLETLLTNFTGWRAIIALLVASKVLHFIQNDVCGC
jgi:hypothetical protein